MKKVTVYTDGSCLGNPGAGGYGAILSYGDTRKELSAGFAQTTNNQMEMMAVIVALEALKEPCKVSIVTDSKYVKNAFTQKWLENWQKNGWKTAAKKPVKNKELWLRMCEAMKAHQVSWQWVKGHSGHPENERCDELARAAALGAR